MKHLRLSFTYGLFLSLVIVSSYEVKAMEELFEVPLSITQKENVQPGSLFIEDMASKDFFVVRWEFQKFCDHIFDLELKENLSFNVANIQAGDLIFLRGINAPEFFEKVAPHITVPYLIVSHGEYRDSFKEEYLNYLQDPNLIAWFGVHPCKVRHEKFYPLPLGIWSPRTLTELAEKKQTPSSYCDSIQSYIEMFKALRNVEKTTLVYSNFTNSMHPNRAKVAELFNGKSFCLAAQKVPFKTYLEHMASCKFALSPEGEGIDCYRNYEALLVGCIPILIKCQLQPLFEDLPVLFIDKWEDITEDFLNEQYKRITARQYSLKKLYCSYWLNKINEVKKEFFSKKQS